MYQKISVKRLGRKWVVFHYGFIAVWLTLASIFFFIDSGKVRSLMLLHVTPAAMVVFLIYFTIIIALNLRLGQGDKADDHLKNKG